MKEGKDVPKKHSVVSINRFHPGCEDWFYREFKLLDTCDHPSIVKLLGICVQGGQKILVVEYPYNSYLNDHLFYDDTPILTWVQRLKICLDVAKALNYLHFEMAGGQSVVHGDIQSSNIALDKNWGAKIADFGHSVFSSPNEDDETLEYARGIPDVNVDPEYRKTRRLTRESDVYSFGAVLFEVLCGRLGEDPIYLKESDQGLPFVARRCFREGTLMEMIDPLLGEESDENSYILKRGPNKDSLDIFVKIAYQCVTEIPNQRPPVNVVVKELQEALLLQVIN
uniref:probable receptor-like protein kinase At2g23200 n=1 Tax=Erigeron canadensis TaxID=72917 RepID=UPI001CB8AC80|nr:probable receptor-like protein kinase At2g23200 [Erigeron canadensis]